MGAFIDLTGKKFGKVTALAKTNKRCSGTGAVMWECRCDCGTIFTTSGNSLRHGGTTTCGCSKSNPRKHALHGTRAYWCYHAMIQRCYNRKNAEFHHYGGRGIKVCDRWLRSVENFYADMGAPPESKSIDRIDNDGNYSPTNCRWATRQEQNNNMRKPAIYNIRDNLDLVLPV